MVQVIHHRQFRLKVIMVDLVHLIAMEAQVVEVGVEEPALLVAQAHQVMEVMGVLAVLLQ
jgi:hypothetical protein